MFEIGAMLKKDVERRAMRGLCLWLLCSVASGVAGQEKIAEILWADGMEGGLLSEPPVDIREVSEILPLGDVDGDSHVIPVDHLYVRLPSGPPISVKAMAAGELVLVLDNSGAGGGDFEIYIRHSDRLTTQFDHLGALSAKIDAHINTLPDGWIDLGDSRLLLLGEVGSPPPLLIASGETVGSTRGNGRTLDVGVVDFQRDNGQLGRGARRIPSVMDVLGLINAAPVNPPFNGHRAINGGCFAELLPDHIRQDWISAIQRIPEGCGSPGQDVADALQGVWFNPALDSLPTPPPDTENAVFVLVPFNESPLTSLRLAFGSDDPLALLDPNGLFPASASAFGAVVNASPGTLVNPDPALVTPAAGTVCYDMFAPVGAGFFNLFYLRLSDPNTLEVGWDRTERAVPGCATELPAFPGSFEAVFTR